MIVEFIGCTGAGKTTLIGDVRSALAGTTPVATANELVAGKIGLGAIRNPTLQNLAHELVCLPYFARSLRKHRAFIALTVGILFRNSHLSLATIDNLRSLERKIGGYEILRHSRRDAVILVDEGPAQALHMFAFGKASVSPREITRFARVLPLPDLLVYVKSPKDDLTRRTLRRPDPPREMAVKHGVLAESYIKNAVALFDQLVETGSLRCRVLIVNNPEAVPQQYAERAKEIARSILDWKRAAVRTTFPGPPVLVPGGEIC